MRVGIDSPVEADGDRLAADVVQHLRDDGLDAKRLRCSDFLRSRSLRLEFGTDPESLYESWYDVAALRREALDRLGPGGDGDWLPALRDPETDRSVRVAREQATPGSIVVLDGRFLLRPELAGALDLTVHLTVSAAARARRGDELAQQAWDHYRELCAPEAVADLVVRYEHPDRPAIRQPQT